MASEGSIKALKDAFDRGYNSFLTAEPNAKGHYINPPNPYVKNTLTYKEYERGYNRSYSDNLSKVTK